MTATFTPTANLAYSTVYTATITTGATTPGGSPLLTNSVWTFTTITPPPTVTVMVPANVAVNVPIGQVLSATFSEAMAPATISASTFTVTGPGGAKASNVFWAVGGLPGAIINYGDGGTMVGTIISMPGITVSSPAQSTSSTVTTINGRVIALNASTTIVNTVINVP
jgi:hypothetical protein